MDVNRAAGVSPRGLSQNGSFEAVSSKKPEVSGLKSIVSSQK